MNRRSFFKKAVLGAAVVAVAPAVLSEPFVPKLGPAAVTIGEYCNYVNFSSEAVAASCDEMVADVAAQLGYQAGLSINELYKATLDGAQA